MWTEASKQYNLMNDFFKALLELEEPWTLTHVELDEKERTWHLLIDFKPGTLFACPHCGNLCTAHDTKVKTWRHLDVWDWKTYLHARVPRNRMR